MKGIGKPKEFLHKATGGVLNFFQEGINAGKRIARTSADSIDGRKMTSAKGSILVEDEERLKQEIIRFNNKNYKPGCGTREVARRLKQIQRRQNAKTI